MTASNQALVALAIVVIAVIVYAVAFGAGYLYQWYLFRRMDNAAKKTNHQDQDLP